jgi:hypothetical protein
VKALYSVATKGIGIRLISGSCGAAPFGCVYTQLESRLCACVNRKLVTSGDESGDSLGSPFSFCCGIEGGSAVAPPPVLSTLVQC